MASMAVHLGNFRIEDAQRLTQEYDIPVQSDQLQWLESAAANERRLAEEDPEWKNKDSGASNPRAADRDAHKGYRVKTYVQFPYTSLALPLLEWLLQYFAWLCTAGWSCCILKDKCRRTRSEPITQDAHEEFTDWEKQVAGEAEVSWWEQFRMNAIGDSSWYFPYTEPGEQSCLGDLLLTCKRGVLRPRTFPCRPLNANLYTPMPEPETGEATDYLHCRQCRRSSSYQDCLKHCWASCGIISCTVCAHIAFLPFFILQLSYGVVMEMIGIPLFLLVAFLLALILVEGFLLTYAYCCGKISSNGCSLVARVLSKTGPTGRETQGLSPPTKLHPLIDVLLVRDGDILKFILHRINSTYSRTAASDFIMYNPFWTLFEPGIPVEEIARGWKEAILLCGGKAPKSKA